MRYRTLANSQIAFVVLGDLFYRRGSLKGVDFLAEVEKHLRSFDMLLDLTHRRLCKRTGHVMVYGSDGGPETGHICTYCRRCGWNVSSILY